MRQKQWTPIQTQKNAVESKTDTFSIPETVDSINALSDGFDTIRRVYSDIQDGGTFDFSLLDSKNFRETFSGLGDEYSAFIEKVASSTTLTGARMHSTALSADGLNQKGCCKT